MENLHGHNTIQDPIVCLIDVGHAAAANVFYDLITLP